MNEFLTRFRFSLRCGSVVLHVWFLASDTYVYVRFLNNSVKAIRNNFRKARQCVTRCNKKCPTPSSR